MTTPDRPLTAEEWARALHRRWNEMLSKPNGWGGDGDEIELFEEYFDRALATAREEGRVAGMREAAELCEAKSRSPRGNDYGSIGGAFDECAEDIRTRLAETPGSAAPAAKEREG